jgi:hypothetical protein
MLRGLNLEFIAIIYRQRLLRSCFNGLHIRADGRFGIARGKIAGIVELWRTVFLVHYYRFTWRIMATQLRLFDLGAQLTVSTIGSALSEAGQKISSALSISSATTSRS